MTASTSLRVQLRRAEPGVVIVDLSGDINRDAEGVLDLEHTYSLLEEVPAGKAVLSQGGVKERDQVEELERAGVDAVILGAWSLAGDLPATLRTLRGDSR